MKIEILDEKAEGKGKCFLVKATLRNYLDALPDDFDKYRIQRDRATNVYLDRLIDTVLTRGHIPTIVLIANTVNKRNNLASDLQILDGLQRTLRLRDIADSIRLAENVDVTLTRSKLLSLNSSALGEHSTDASIFLRIVDEIKKRDWNTVSQSLDEYQWFEIWSGLSEEDQVRKMLLLNAGHKPVKTRHQLELLFLSVLPRLQSKSAEGFVIVREKESSALVFSKRRNIGEYHFASVVAALVAYFLGKPVTTNAELIADLQADESDASVRRIVEGFSYKFSSTLVSFLVDLDKIISSQDETNGVQWLGREVVLVGIFAALGDYAREERLAPEKVFSRLLQRIQTTNMNLEGFEEARNQQDLGRVNVGAVNKRAVFEAVRDLLSDHQISRLNWKNYFRVK